MICMFKVIHYYSQMYLKMLEICVLLNFRNMCLKIYEVVPAHFLSTFSLAWLACLKKQE